MSCPNCDHTMQGIGIGNFWCPRCGTLRINGIPDIAAPTLLGRCREFEEALVRTETAPRALCFLWRRLGLNESIQTPQLRRPIE